MCQSKAEQAGCERGEQGCGWMREYTIGGAEGFELGAVQ